MTEEEKAVGRDIRFCPYCFQMSFDVSEIRADHIYCEMCGVDVPVGELVKE